MLSVFIFLVNYPFKFLHTFTQDELSYCQHFFLCLDRHYWFNSLWVSACVRWQCDIWCYSLFHFSDRRVLRNGSGSHGFSDHGAWCFSANERYWLSLASETWTGQSWPAWWVLACWLPLAPAGQFICSVALPASSCFPRIWAWICCSSRNFVWLGLGSLLFFNLLFFLNTFPNRLFLITFFQENWKHCPCEMHY